MRFFFVLLFSICSLTAYCQTDSISINRIEKIEEINKTIFKDKNPMRAALYSTVLPGLGQAYNNKFWKVPIIWGLIGLGTGFMVYNNENRNLYQDAFIAELNNKPHQFSGILNATSLAKAGDLHKRQLDYAIVLTSLVYILSILDANVDAHLSEFDRQFSLTPVYNPNQSIGLNFKIKL